MKIMRVVLQATVFLLLLAVIVGLLFWIQYHQVTSTDDDPITRLEKISDTVRIHIDTTGVACIYAENERDLVTALGYYTASRQFWQMELMRSTAKGNLSKFFLHNTIEFDLLFRNLQLDSLSLNLYRNISPHSRNWLQCYSNGINQFISDKGNKLPWDFQLLGWKPEPWQPYEALLIYRLLYWLADDSWKVDFLYRRMYEGLPGRLANEILPVRKQAQEENQKNKHLSETLMRLWQIDTNLREWLGLYSSRGNNYCWAIGGALTGTGEAVLINQWPLGTSLPFSWLEVQLSSPEIKASGLTIPGFPAIIVGRNQRIAWGLTQLDESSITFDVERIDPQTNLSSQNKERVRLKRTKEHLSIKNRNQVDPFLIYKTQQGAVILHPSLENLSRSRAVSIKWDGWVPGDEIKTFLELMKARGWQEFRRALRYYKLAAQCIVYADQSGNIGLQKARVNKPVSSFASRFNQSNYDLQEQSAEQQSNLYTFNPKENWLMVSNYTTYPPFSREERVVQPSFFLNRLRHSPAFGRAIPLISEPDNPAAAKGKRTTPGNRWDEWLRNLDLNGFDLEKRAQHDLKWVLSNWDKHSVENEVAVCVFEVWQWFILKKLFQANMGEELFGQLMETPHILQMIFYKLIDKNESNWFDDPATPGIVENKQHLLKASFEETAQFLKTVLGGEIYRWSWLELIQSDTLQNAALENFRKFIQYRTPGRKINSDIPNQSGRVNGREGIQNITNNQALFLMDWQHEHHYRSGFGNLGWYPEPSFLLIDMMEMGKTEKLKKVLFLKGDNILFKKTLTPN